MKMLKRERQVPAFIAEPDDEIDLPEIPKILGWKEAKAGRLVRPARKMVSLRLDQDVIDWLKSSGPGYQTRANALLRDAMLSAKTGKPPVHKNG